MILKTRIITAVFFSFVVSMPSYSMELAQFKKNSCILEIPCGKQNQTKAPIVLGQFQPEGGEAADVYYQEKEKRHLTFSFDESGNKLNIIKRDNSKYAGTTSMEMWDTSAKKLLNVPELGEFESVFQACFDKAGTQLVRNSGANVYVYNFTTQEQKPLFTHKETITAMCFAGQSNLVLGDMYGQVVMIDKDGQIVACGQGNSDNINDRIKAMCYNEKTSCLATVNYNNTVSIYNKNLEVQDLFSSSRYANKEDKDLHKICYDTSGNYLLVVVNDQQSVCLIDTKKRTSKLIDKPQNMSLLGIYFDTKDQSFKLLLFAGSDEIRVYDIKKKYTTELIVAPAQFTALSAVIDPSGKYLAVAGETLGELFVRLYAYKQFTSQ